MCFRYSFRIPELTDGLGNGDIGPTARQSGVMDLSREFRQAGGVIMDLWRRRHLEERSHTCSVLAPTGRRAA